eukprot:2888622-Prymnesium_polylepis.3
MESVPSPSTSPASKARRARCAGTPRTFIASCSPLTEMAPTLPSSSVSKTSRSRSRCASTLASSPACGSLSCRTSHVCIVCICHRRSATTLWSFRCSFGVSSSQGAALCARACACASIPSTSEGDRHRQLGPAALSGRGLCW